jgi:flagellar basal body-associated protein FliL
VKLGESPLPKEILSRRNGIPAAGYDLREPEESLFGRKPASKKDKEKDKDIEVKVGNYFVELDTIYSNARVGNKSEGALILSLTLEVDTFNARNEVNTRKQEFVGLINNSLYQFQRDFLLTYDGKMELKVKIQEELNRKIKTGKVVDVLFSEIQMRN